MIILPVSTPAIAIDQNTVNQSQQNQINQSEQSRKATDTVVVSSKAREMAGTELNYSPSASSTPAPADKPAANSVSLATEVKNAPPPPPPAHVAADIEVAEKVAASEVVEQQRPTNAMTGKQETTKIDVVA